MSRRVTVDLSKYDSRWQGCQIVLDCKGFREQVESQKQFDKYVKKGDRLTRRIKSKMNRIEQLEDEAQIEQVYDDIDELEEEGYKVAFDLIKAFQNHAKERFVEGIIYDESLKETRDMRGSDIDSFDEVILKDIKRALTGELSKKK